MCVMLHNENLKWKKTVKSNMTKKEAEKEKKEKRVICTLDSLIIFGIRARGSWSEMV